MTMIAVDSLSKTFADRAGSTVLALDRVTLRVDEGEFVALLGPSGCGKSTLLRIMAGLAAPSSGQVTIAGEDVDGPAAGVGMVFQSYTSFPWLSVTDNVAFGLHLRGMARPERMRLASGIIERVGLSKFASAFPSGLSGGMQQRVAIARALATEPRVLLMDEPFGALDAMIRVEMQALLVDLWQQDRKTVVFVTHDIDEAVLLADRIVVLSPHPGRIHDIVPVDLPRLRTMTTMEDQAYMVLRHRLRTMILDMGRPSRDGPARAA